MIDPLAQIVSLLQPSAGYTKHVEAAGTWRVERSEDGRPFYCAVLEGSCRLHVGETPPITLTQGDFALVPAAFDFATSSIDPMPRGQASSVPIELRPGLFRLGRQEGPAEVRSLIGYCTFGSPDAALLVSLLPRIIVVRDEARLTTLVGLVNEETRAHRPGREVVLARLIELLLIEALRTTSNAAAPPGLLRGLADERLAAALRQIHERPTEPWTIAALASAAALSRTIFFERFREAIGLAPMEYLLHWRMALAKDQLRRGAGGISEVARRVGYGSASTFSTAFLRHVGLTPTRYARENPAG